MIGLGVGAMGWPRRAALGRARAGLCHRVACGCAMRALVELVDMPGMSLLGSISRLGICHLKKAGGVFRDLFCDPTEGILNISFGDLFYMRGRPPSGKKHQYQ